MNVKPIIFVITTYIRHVEVPNMDAHLQGRIQKPSLYCPVRVEVGAVQVQGGLELSKTGE